MPVLFSLLILICFPAFYIIQSVLGPRLSLGQMISIILSGFVYTTAIMVSSSTIVLFFMITGGNYSFIKLLHVAVIAFAGIFGMKHIVDALTFSCEKKEDLSQDRHSRVPVLDRDPVLRREPAVVEPAPFHRIQGNALRTFKGASGEFLPGTVPVAGRSPGSA